MCPAQNQSNARSKGEGKLDDPVTKPRPSVWNVRSFVLPESIPKGPSRRLFGRFGRVVAESTGTACLILERVGEFRGRVEILVEGEALFPDYYFPLEQSLVWLPQLKVERGGVCVGKMNCPGGKYEKGFVYSLLELNKHETSKGR